MASTIYKTRTRLTTFLKYVKLNSIRPFTETPSIEHTQTKDVEEDKEKLCASDLFSLFTADIIREKVVFTR